MGLVFRTLYFFFLVEITISSNCTSSGSKKPATLETGAVVQVPYHVITGDLVKVNTVDCEYLEKVK
jgi:hypothetical protein